MDMTVRYENHPGFLLVDVSGQWTEKAARRYIESTGNEANRRGYTRMFVDIRKVPHLPNDSACFQIGKYIATFLNHPFKTAALIRPDMMDTFVENVAVNRGADYANFSEKQAAIEWLTQGGMRECRRCRKACKVVI